MITNVVSAITLLACENSEEELLFLQANKKC